MLRRRIAGGQVKRFAGCVIGMVGLFLLKAKNMARTQQCDLLACVTEDLRSFQSSPPSSLGLQTATKYLA